MSNHAAIAAVSAALNLRLRKAIKVTGLDADVSHTRPGTANAFRTKVGVHLFLYRITPNAALRGVDLPTRDERGTIASRPTAAIELHYLLSFVCEGQQQNEPKVAGLGGQCMLGAVVVDLHSNPVLTPDEIRAATTDTVLSGSGLERQADRVRLMPEAIDLEEFSKLWSVFFQTQYLLSVAYKASVVLLEAEVAVPEAGRVRTRGVFSTPMPPEVTSLSPQILNAGGQVVLRGTSLRGASTKVRVVRADGGVRELDPAFILDDRLEVVLPVDLRAGIASIQVVTRHEASSGLPARAFELESPPVAFMLVPRVVTAGTSPTAESPTLVEIKGKPKTKMVVGVVPSIAADQVVRILIGSVRVQATVVAKDPSRLQFAVPVNPAIVAGQSYPLRVEVDGAVSLVEADGAGFKPRLRLPGGP